MGFDFSVKGIMDIKGKNIFITGANRGIGKALAEEAARRGLSVHAVCRKPQEGLKEELIALGAKDVHQWALDLSSKEDINAFIEKVGSSNTAVDILVNNAGQLTGGLIEEQPLEDIYQMIQVNLMGLIHLTHGLLPHMLKLKQAKIVNNSSISGKMFLPCASTYAASKAGVAAFTDCIKQELRGTGVSTLLLITPGVDTRMFNEIPGLYEQHLETELLSSIPPKTWAEQVFKAIERDWDTCWPQRARPYFGVKLGHHWPGLLERLVRPRFKR